MQSPKIKRSDFPKDFVFGSATSAYQVEGAWNADGKGLSNWDVFTMRTPGKIHGGTNACTTINQYNRIEDDVALMKKVGLDSYRFSISWARVLPGGRLSAGKNQHGIDYYDKLIDLLLAEGIKPCATIFHWDVPQCLEDQYDGFLSSRIVSDFCEFAEVCFWEFGDRVKYWITLNEPWSFAVQGYVTGHFPPARGQDSVEPITSHSFHRGKPGAQFHCSKRKPGTEPYKVAHNLILSHAQAVDIYRQRYQAHQGGKIGVTNVSQWFEPLHHTAEDKDAASRGIDFMLGWFVEPIVKGHYPSTMRANVGDRLPKFSREQVKLVKGSYDFLGINYYTSIYARNSPKKHWTKPSYETDKEITLSDKRDGVPIGPKAGSDWLNIVPHGIYDLLVHIKKKYDDPIIHITENGVDEVNNTKLTVSKALSDEMRIEYHVDHLIYVKKAMQEGVQVKSYYIWSMFDNFEWAAGFSVRFGIFYVDYHDGQLTRLPKASAIWLMNFLDEKHKRITLKSHIQGGRGRGRGRGAEEDEEDEDEEEEDDEDEDEDITLKSHIQGGRGREEEEDDDEDEDEDEDEEDEDEDITLKSYIQGGRGRGRGRGREEEEEDEDEEGDEDEDITLKSHIQGGRGRRGEEDEDEDITLKSHIQRGRGREEEDEDEEDEDDEDEDEDITLKSHIQGRQGRGGEDEEEDDEDEDEDEEDITLKSHIQGRRGRGGEEEEEDDEDEDEDEDDEDEDEDEDEEDITLKSHIQRGRGRGREEEDEDEEENEDKDWDEKEEEDDDDDYDDDDDDDDNDDDDECGFVRG